MVDLVGDECAASMVDLTAMVVTLQDAESEGSPLSAAVSCHAVSLGREPLDGGSLLLALVCERIAGGVAYRVPTNSRVMHVARCVNHCKGYAVVSQLSQKFSDQPNPQLVVPTQCRLDQLGVMLYHPLG